MQKFPDVHFSPLVAFVDVVNNIPIVMIAGMPHLVKRMKNAVECSLHPKLKRDLHYGKYPVNDNMIFADVSHQQMHTKLTMAHFVKDAYSGMNVVLVVQVFSLLVARMLQRGVDDDKVTVSLKKELYLRLIEMVENLDRLINICNGRSRSKVKYSAFS